MTLGGISGFELSQVNIARLLAPLDSAPLADFVAALDPVNAAADRAPGFRWRLRTEDGDATAVRVFDDEWLLLNMSTWASHQELVDYVYGADHVAVLRERRRWFARPVEAMAVLWWVPAGHRPTAAEAQERLVHLREHGPTPSAFTLRAVFPPPGAASVAPVVDLPLGCGVD
ncbi:DUF3291 domain-containing protein [Saccharothrix coeruleofusca]|uniref:DUF3291 domain-containing protein n=1 Tax=Saccharothrix coeruleofusca TaxID=33919 RepID=A0A918AH06_9PSEU|nr:DUF3291 domain-containing protein [Saccharothrix coeruleofusca]GGP36490.1 hypothetical protein GCM10010185_04510 [Saccharothrix coeruleofusca]